MIFYLGMRLFSGEFPREPYFILLAAPGLLFFIDGLLAKRTDQK